MNSTHKRLTAALLALAPFASTTSGLGAEFSFERHTLKVPDGYSVIEAATTPLVERPISADFDEWGRLYVTESSGSNDPVEIQARERPHRVLRLQDQDGDGVFDSRTVFADQMMLPQGALWHRGSLYVAAPPEIWKLTDHDGDGIAEQREVWLDPGTLTGCANDLHGPYLGPDGYIYWAKGAFATQTYRREDGSEWTTRAAHLFRRHPDGGAVEPVMTGGMDNPVEIAFSPRGERFLTTTFLQHPSGGRRDGIIHAVYGGVYGKIHDVIEDHPQTGSLLEPMTHMGPAAACALLRPESTALDPQAPNILYASAFNLNSVSRHILKPKGATFETEDADFLTADHRDFHPTDLIEDADGSLLVIDTGGWYKLCCPTSQLHKPETLGAIYRVRRNQPESIKDPRGLSLDWKNASPQELAARLSDPRPTVVNRAMTALATPDPTAATALSAALRNETSRGARVAAVWTLTRIDSPIARALIRLALDDRDPTVRQAAIHSAALWRDSLALSALRSKLAVESPALRRAIAEALGRIGDTSSVPAILQALQRPIDKVEAHSLTYALIEINAPEMTRAGLSSPYTRVRRAAMLALDQAADHSLRPEELAVFLAAEAQELRETAHWILKRRPRWGEALAPYFEARSLAIENPADPLIDQMSVVVAEPRVQQILLSIASNQALKQQVRAKALECFEDLYDPIPQNLQNALLPFLEPDQELFPTAVQVAGSLLRRDPEARILRDNLALLVLNNHLGPNELLLETLDALPEGLIPMAATPPPLRFLIAMETLSDTISPGTPYSAKATAARLIAREAIPKSLQEFARSFLPSLRPEMIYALLPAFRDADAANIEALIKTLEQHPQRPQFSAPALRSVSQTLPPALQDALNTFISARLDDASARQTKLESTLAKLDQGDIERGQKVFNSAEAACHVCHEIGYLGGDLGPDLTSIGQARNRRDLLEAILYPSESFVRSYEPHQITTTDGSAYLGIINGESARELRLKVGPDAEVAIPIESIASRSLAAQSLMPSGLGDALSDRELADLLAFLQATKWR